MSATTWVEVSTGALARNYAAVARHAGVPVCAVVKANAYGCGLVECARVFRDAGASWLAVTRVEEARALRDVGIDGNVLVLTPPPPDALTDAIGLDCAIALGSASDVEAYASAARKAGKPARVHIKVDTGMGRLGVTSDEAPEVARRVAGEADIVLEGVWTHFADAADDSDTGGRRQLARFVAVRESLGRHGVRTLVHAANSAALLALPGSRFDMVRIGTLLYGQQPPGATAPFTLEDPFAWYAKVVGVRDLPAGATVGYGSEWRAKRAVRVATIPVGWADGFTVEPHTRTESPGEAARTAARAVAAAAHLRPSGRFVWIGSTRAPVVGRVGMQATTVTVPSSVEAGDTVRLPARRLLVNAAIERVYVP
jgi:alanine racemase